MIHGDKKTMIKRIGGRTLQNCCRGCSARNTNYTSPIRRYSSTSAPAASYTSVSSPIGSLTVELDRIAPKFKVQASNIQILNSPAAFYETLKVRVCVYELGKAWLITSRIKYAMQNDESISQLCILEKRNTSFFRS